MFGSRIEEPFLPLCRPSLAREDIAVVTGVLRSGWLTTGPRVADLEAAFARTTGCRHATGSPFKKKHELNTRITNHWSAGSFVLLLLARAIPADAGVRNA